MSQPPAELASIGIVPVIVIDDPARAVDLAHALAAGGIPCAEITLRTPDALDALSALAGVDGFIAGAGTVVSTEQVDAAIDAGARYLVSPGFDEELIDRARDRGVAFVPGVATPTEMQRAMRAGLDHVKLFPAGVLGGIPAIDAYAGPFPELRFMPSNGVNARTFADYLAHPSVFAVSGSWVAPREAIRTGDFATIERLSAEATRAAA